MNRTRPAFVVRRAAARGTLRNHWLDAQFSFSFADFDDPHWRRFGALLALNEDRVQPASGFDMHPHADLEIVMLPRSAAIEHHDSQGRHQFVQPGELQWMRAGRGIRHRQWNPSADVVDHHFQIWFAPGARGLEPRVERLRYDAPEAGRWHTLVAPAGGSAGDATALDIGVDVTLALGAAAPGRALDRPARPTRAAYLHLMHGRIEVHAGGTQLATLDGGDAIAFFAATPALQLQAAMPSELLGFDLPALDPPPTLPLPSLHSKELP